MAGPRRLGTTEIDDALTELLARRPDAGIAAVAPDGRFVDLPSSVPAGDRPRLDGRAGIDLVRPDCRAAVLQQFLDLDESGASSLQVTTAQGEPATYFLLDCTATHGVVILLLAVTGPAGDTLPDIPETAPIVPRYGRIWRTEVAEPLRVEETVTAMLGWTLEDYRSRPTSEFIHPDDSHTSISNWFDVISSPPGTARRWRGRTRRKDGGWSWMEFTNTNHLDDAEQPHVLTEMVDVSEEMRAAEEVWESRELLRTLTDALPVGVLQVGLDWRVVYANGKLHELLGVPADGDLAEALDGLSSDERRRIAAIVGEVLATGADADVEVTFDGPVDGARRYLQVAMRALRDRDDVVTGAVVSVSDTTEASELRRQLEVRATYDDLTGCLNRASIVPAIERSLREAASGGTAVVFVDLDGFKAINDRVGHAAGDEVLRVAAERFRGAVRARDLVGRMGGDEFVVLCPDVADPAAALDVAQRIARAVTGPVDVAGGAERITPSVGVAWRPAGTLDVDALVAAADAAMYDAKRVGDGVPILSGAL